MPWFERAAQLRARPAPYTAPHPFLSLGNLQEGAIDLPANLPPADIVLISPDATLVVLDDFYPALAELLLCIAGPVCDGPGPFEQAGAFPSRDHLDFPISDAARRFFEFGPSLLPRYLPFWAATTLDRLKILLLALVTLIYPLSKILPPTYGWRMRARLNRGHKALRAIERELDAAVADPGTLARNRDAHDCRAASPSQPRPSPAKSPPQPDEAAPGEASTKPR
ncbi:MAG: hypothetical protein E5W94_23675 [Mesorhizobium sp.]|nr:MAG: hypothetical protein E5W94_23675 [Mesorhizobium sp.]